MRPRSSARDPEGGVRGAVAIIRPSPRFLWTATAPRSGDSRAKIDIMEGDCALTLFARRAEPSVC